MTLYWIVEDYMTRFRPRARESLAWFGEPPTLSVAICAAALALDSNGKRSRHFWRVPRATLKEAKLALLAGGAEIEQCKDFDKLHSVVERLVDRIWGLGELYVYDTAFRIGVKKGFLPEKVYLHAGTRRGARNLGLDFKAKSLEVKDLPKALRQLQPYEIEDLLCIYEEQLKSVAAEDAAVEGPEAPESCFPPAAKGCR